MRKLRFGALAASAALASVTVLGAGTAMAQEGDGEPNTATVESEGHYTMTATAIGECKVEFDLVSHYDDNYGNWRGDYQVGEEDPITAPGANESVGNRGETYRPVVTNQPGTAGAIEDRENPYDFGVGPVTVDLTEERTVPYADGDVNEVYELPGVEANETGEHVISFGVYQGPPAYDAEIYNTDGEIVVTGCPTLTLPERISSELNLPDFSELSSNLSS